MRVLFHPEFANDILRFQKEYARVSGGLGGRFRMEIDEGIAAVIRSPGSAGHFVERRSAAIRDLRRRNLRSFPFFILYGCSEDTVVFGSVIPNRSDPLTWLIRFTEK
jgi:hypothetical protein